MLNKMFGRHDNTEKNVLVILFMVACIVLALYSCCMYNKSYLEVDLFRCPLFVVHTFKSIDINMSASVPTSMYFSM